MQLSPGPKVDTHSENTAHKPQQYLGHLQDRREKVNSLHTPTITVQLQARGGLTHFLCFGLPAALILEGSVLTFIEA